MDETSQSVENTSSNIIPTVDRPDIAKTGHRKSLSAKEIKDVFFKCLMLANINFEENHPLYIHTTYTDKKTDNTHKVRTGFYTATCTLTQFKCDNDPIHVILLRDEEDETEARQRNKLVYLRKSYNLVVFDEADWKAIGVEISDKDWLQPLTKKLVHNLFKLLFYKISSLKKGEVISEYNLNEILLNVEKNIAKNRAVVKNLIEENIKLKKELKKLELSSKLRIDDLHDGVLTQLINYYKSSLNFIEDTVNSVVKLFFTTKYSKAEYSKFFRQKNGALNPINREKIAEFLVDSFRVSKPYVTPIVLSNGLLMFQNKNTFQKVFMTVSPTTTSIDTIAIDSSGLTQVTEPIIFNITALFVKERTRVKHITAEAFTKRSISKLKILKAKRMPILKSNKQTLFKIK